MSAAPAFTETSWAEGPVALVFPGQGAQAVGMGRDLYAATPIARAIFDRADEILGFGLSTLCFEGPEDELNDTYNSQPALLTVSIAYLTALRMYLAQTAQSVEPMFVAGHSLGEYSALVAAGVLDFGDALQVVRERGRLMREAGVTRPGGMVAIVGLEAAVVEDICHQVADCGIIVPANQNTPVQTVISGEVPALLKAMELAKAAGAKQVVRLKVTIASHSPLMSSVAQGIAQALAAVHLRAPQIAIIANMTAQPLQSVAEIRQELIDQVTQPVLWTQSVSAMAQAGVRTCIEVGPGHVLCGLIRRITTDIKPIPMKDLGIDWSTVL